MTALIAYIDGFNLYHAIGWTCGRFAESLARPGEIWVKLTPFSAYATWLPDAHQRHIEYVKAIEHAGVKCTMGHFKNKPVKCNKCSQTWVHHEEKETDVHIAARIVADAFKGRFDRAILITADSDLAPAVKIVKAAFPMKQIFRSAFSARAFRTRSRSQSGIAANKGASR